MATPIGDIGVAGGTPVGERVITGEEVVKNGLGNRERGARDDVNHICACKYEEGSSLCVER